jgi:hypothetical protein
MSPEIGRELKVSELVPETVVILHKPSSRIVAYATMWVVQIGDTWVHFRAGAVETEFFALRCGPDLESITDDSHVLMQIYEYLGKV